MLAQVMAARSAMLVRLTDTVHNGRGTLKMQDLTQRELTAADP